MNPKWDLVALGEVMLRLDPGDERVSTTRSFRAWEGGGEYNVARSLRRAFGKRTAIVTALADNPIGRLIEDLMLQGGVALDHLYWTEFDGVGRESRNGLNFTERGFGIRGASGTYDRGHTAASQLKVGDVDWNALFGLEGSRWFHCGGIFAGLSETTPEVAKEAMQAARAHGVKVSYDLNYRPSLWRSIGGEAKAREVNGALAPFVDVMIGNEGHFAAVLGIEGDGFSETASRLADEFPNVSVIATTTRTGDSSNRTDWGAHLWTRDGLFQAPIRSGVEIFDRVGGGDSFASGLIYGMLEGKDSQWCVECGAAHGALAMTTPGDSSAAILEEVLAAMKEGHVGEAR